MSEYLTADMLDDIESCIPDDDDGAQFGGFVGIGREMLTDLIAQARLVPDPDALPLSCAMRMARERTEAGTETWVWMTTRTVGVTVLRYALDIWYRTRPDLLGLWDGSGSFHDAEVESAVCRLVTQEEGEKLLKGPRC